MWSLPVPRPHRPGVEMQVITGPCPFTLWSLDLLGPFPKAPGQYTMLIVAIDYFTKWIDGHDEHRVLAWCLRKGAQ